MGCLWRASCATNIPYSPPTTAKPEDPTIRPMGQFRYNIADNIAFGNPGMRKVAAAIHNAEIHESLQIEGLLYRPLKEVALCPSR